jgi:hypothetical protein
MGLNDKVKNRTPLATYVPAGIAAKFKRLTAHEGSTVAETLREMVLSYCEDMKP